MSNIIKGTSQDKDRDSWRHEFLFCKMQYHVIFFKGCADSFHLGHVKLLKKKIKYSTAYVEETAVYSCFEPFYLHL